MWSIGEILVITIATAWVFGPNEIQRVARAAGKLTGQATGYLYRARAHLFQFAEETEVTKLHQEMQATMYQLNAIRAELQGGINIFNPGPLTQRVLHVRPPPPPPGQGAAGAAAPGFQAAQQQQQEQQQHSRQYGQQYQGLQHQHGQQQPSCVPWAPQPAGHGAQQERSHSPQHLGNPLTVPPPTPADSPQQLQTMLRQQPPTLAGSWAAGALQPAAAAAAPIGAAVLERQRSQHQDHLPVVQQQGQPLQKTTGQQLEQEQQVYPLTVPVSAVAAGWAPDRAGTTPTGSDIMLDALAEQLVAVQVLRLHQQQLAVEARAAAQQRQAQQAQQAAQQQVAEVQEQVHKQHTAQGQQGPESQAWDAQQAQQQQSVAQQQHQAVMPPRRGT